MHYTVQSSTLSGQLNAPPSKSHTLRAILFASMASGQSMIKNSLISPDTDAMIAACQQLGARIKKDNDVLFIEGVAGVPKCKDVTIDAGNSGQVLRFVSAMAALNSSTVILTGDASIRKSRPVLPLLKGLSDLGAHCISVNGDDHAPIQIQGPMCSGLATIDGEDSQPVSALLMTSAFLPGKTTVHVKNPGETPWVALTLDWFDRLGITYSQKNFTEYIVHGGGTVSAFDYTVPGDFSSIAYPLVAALITGAEIRINQIDMQDAQGDKQLIDVLKEMGANIETHDRQLHVKPSQQLIGRDIDVNTMIDALPILAVVACYAKGTTRLMNAAIARKKESDRLAVMTKELKKMGANIAEDHDSLMIQGSTLHAACMGVHHDHRIAMSLAVAALGVYDVSEIDGVECIRKSYPDFLQAMQSLGAQIEEK